MHPNQDKEDEVKHPRRLILLMALLIALALAAGCAHAPAEMAPPAKAEDPLIKGVDAQATWVGMLYNGFTTTSGEQFDMRELTVAHPSLPYGTKLEVINPKSGKSAVVTVNDRRNLGPGVVLALSKAAADRIDLGGAQRRFMVVYRYAK